MWAIKKRVRGEIFSKIDSMYRIVPWPRQVSWSRRRKVVNCFSDHKIFTEIPIPNGRHYLHLVACCKITYTLVFFHAVHAWIYSDSFKLQSNHCNHFASLFFFLSYFLSLWKYSKKFPYINQKHTQVFELWNNEIIEGIGEMMMYI